MKTFKQFFTENTVDITATPAGGKAVKLGSVDPDEVKKIANYIDRVSSGSQQDIINLINTSKFDTSGGNFEKNKYYQVFAYLLSNEKYKIDWPAFKEHTKNRFTENDLQNVFNESYGSFNLFTDFAKPILSKFVKDNVQDFFEELFVINPAIAGTSVGDGEFILGILGNGIKGVTGDVDVIQIDGTETTLEVGTSNKIIGGSSREKSYLSLARNIIDAIKAPIGESSEIAFNSEQQKWSYVEKLLLNYPVLSGNLNWLISLLKEAANDSRSSDVEGGTAGNSELNRIIGGIVLYDYIIGHNDDIIVSIYHGVKKPAGFKDYDVRYANIQLLGLEGTINLMLEKDWYNFNIDKQATRFTFGT